MVYPNGDGQTDPNGDPVSPVASRSGVPPLPLEHQKNTIEYKLFQNSYFCIPFYPSYPACCGLLPFVPDAQTERANQPTPKKIYLDCFRIVISKFFTIDLYIDQIIAAYPAIARMQKINATSRDVPGS